MSTNNPPIQVQWGPSPGGGVDHYVVNWSLCTAGSASFTSIGSVTVADDPTIDNTPGGVYSSNFSDLSSPPTLNPGDMVSVNVVAVNSAGQVSTAATYSPITPIPPPPAPSPPGMLDMGQEILAGYRTAQVNWLLSPTAGVTFYGVTWTVNGNTYGTSVNQDNTSDMGHYSNTLSTVAGSPELNPGDLVSASVVANTPSAASSPINYPAVVLYPPPVPPNQPIRVSFGVN